MNYKVKQLAIGVAAITALSLAASSFAAAAQFTASSYPATYNASGSSAYGYVSTEAGVEECSSASASATLSEKSSTLSIVEGAVSGCKAFGFLSATVSSNGCTALVHVKEELSADTYSATEDLICPAGKAITTVAGTCEKQVPSQTGNVTVKLTNNTEKGSVRVDILSASFSYTVTKDGIGCPYNGTGVKAGGSINQTKPGEISLSGKTIDVG